MEHAPYHEFGKEPSILRISEQNGRYLNGDRENFSEPCTIIRTDFPGKVASIGMHDTFLLTSNIYLFLAGGERLSAGQQS